jgi:hypothetical protein
MGYSNNNITPPIFGVKNLYTDGCGDSYEKKYYVNGAYIDLCGLPVEEYMKSPCCGSSGSNEGSKPINGVSVVSFESGDTVYYQAFSKFEVTSNLKVTVLSANGVATVLDIYVGNTQSEPEIGETIEMSDIILNITEDENYKYMTVNDFVINIFDIYFGAILLSESGDLNHKLEKLSVEGNNTYDLRYVIPSTDVNYNDWDDIDEFERFCVENQHCFVLCLPKEVYKNEMFSIENYGGTDVKNNFLKSNEINIDGIDYIYLIESAKEDITPFVPLYGEDSVYNYKLTLK